MKKAIIYILSAFACTCGLFAQTPAQKVDTVAVSGGEIITDAYLDTIKVSKQFILNDYSMIGVHYGSTLSRMMFNPPMKQTNLFTPVNIGITFSRYGKMFGYMPYFGMSAGVFYGQDGYKMKADQNGNISALDGAVQAVYDFIEVPVLANFHMDAVHFKMIGELGFYGAYRLSVKRMALEGQTLEHADKFYSYDNRADYGIKGGAGVGFVFEPIELHIKAGLKWSFGSLYQPDYNSPYYYRFAYPLDIIISAGIYFHLTKRTGKTKAQLRKEAHRIVYEEGQQQD